jgi:ribosomal protein S16
MLKIKLTPFGKKHARQFRVAVVDEREKLTSDPAEVIGFYDPKTKKLTIDRPALDKWLKVGAQATPSVRQVLGL